MRDTFCPYCSKVNDSVAFITDAQKRYGKAFIDAALCSGLLIMGDHQNCLAETLIQAIQERQTAVVF
jgi:hypothetical protein